MQQLLLILVGLALSGTVGYFVGFNHGFSNNTPSVPVFETSVSEAADVMANIVGTWQSNDDAAFIREIRNNGTIVDTYTGEDPSEGLWMVFTKEIPDTAFVGTIEEGAVYLSLMMSEDERLYFKVVKADGQSLDLIYLDRGNALSFSRIQ